MPEVLILTGPPGAGKSTVAQALAERYDRVAHIPVDVLRHFVTPTGYARQGQPEYERQRLLAIRNACSLAANFVVARFGVIIDDVLDAPGFLPAYREGLRDVGVSVHLVHLLPTLATCEQREMQRRHGHSPAAWIAVDYQRYTDNLAAVQGVTIESSDLTAHETADRVQALTTSGESIVWRPVG